MKIMVAVKRVVDPNVKVRIKADGSGVELANVKMSLNPFDEIALEEAIRLKEKGSASEIVVVTIGTSACEDVLRTGLAMGADRGILVTTDTVLDNLAIAKVLGALASEEACDILLLGKQAIDNDANQTGQMLAALLGWPQGTFASQVELTDGAVLVTREVDGGLQTVSLRLPAVITADLRLNQPRYASLPNIMKAKKKPLAARKLEELGIDTRPRFKVIAFEEPVQRQAGVKVGSAAELVRKLRDEAGVI